MYSVVFDKWVKSPGNYNDVRNPQHEYWSELILARAEARQFERMAVELENDKKDLKALEKARKKAGDLLTFDALKRKRREIGEGYKNLHEFVAQIDKDRKFSYSTG